MTAKEIAWYLAARHSSPFHARKHLAVVPNVSWGLLPWEADLLVLSKTGYLTEIEIKISMSDWKADLLKKKFKRQHTANSYWPAEQSIKRFWYVAPTEIAMRWHEIRIETLNPVTGIETVAELAPGAGIMAINDKGYLDVLRSPANRPGAKILKDADQLKLLRLAALKAWNLAYKP